MSDQDDVIDPLPGMLAQLDQSLKYAALAAQMVRAQYDAYREQGFSDRQALYLAGMALNHPETPSE